MQYATTHIDGQILILRDFMASLQPPPGSPHALNPDAIVSAEHMRQLSNVKRDVVNTIRQVVDVVSKYAGSALPEPARTRVRGFILHLPQAWASAAQQQAEPSNSGGPARGRGNRRTARRKEPLSRPVSPSTSPRHSRQSSVAAVASAPVPPTAGSATQAAQRILTLATESLDMMRGVTSVVKDSLDRADAWVERLRVVGLQRQGAGAANGAIEGPDAPAGRLPPPLDLMSHRSLAGSTNTSVANSPTISADAKLPAYLRSPAPLSPLPAHSAGGEFFSDSLGSQAQPGSGGGGVNGFGKLNLGSAGSGGGHAANGGVNGSVSVNGPTTPGKKGMFTDDGEIAAVGAGAISRPGSWERGVDHGGTPGMDVDGRDF